MKKLKTMVVTTSRADYGLLHPLIEKIASDEYFDLKLAVTGSHLSTLHGETIKQIKNDGFQADNIIDMTPKGDRDINICESISEGLKGFSNVIAAETPDLIIVLGDRYELLSACTAALIHKIPIAHIHGGESTYGAIDESIRHSVTKMAAVHFPSIPEYGKRIIQLGENPERVYVVGALGIDNIKNIEFMDIEELSQFTNMDFSSKIALMTYHPVTLDECDSACRQVKEILEALLSTNLLTLITAPNTDAGGNSILQMIEEYTQAYPSRCVLIKSLGQRAYLSAMKYARLMIGNSSSGIIESASFKLPVVNIGDRQDGRYKPQNIIDCDCSRESILDAIKKAASPDFKRAVSELKNPYGDGNTAGRIVEILKTLDFSDKSKLLKKVFHDIDFC